MKTRIPSRFLKRFTVLALSFGLLVAGVLKSDAATIVSFTPGETKLTADFTGLADGVSISTLGWTSTYTPLYTGTSPRQASSAPSSRVLTVSGSANSQNVTGPAFISPFAANETAYLQTSINRTTSASSGARVLVRAGSTSVVGFGIENANAIDEKTAFMIYAEGSWKKSAELASPSNWYELRLVVDVNASDITLSVGHVFVRNVTMGEEEFRLIEDLSNIKLGFTDDFNMSDITAWRIESARTNVQIGNLIGGVGTMVIPEPTAAAMLGLVALLGVSPKFRHFFRRH